MSTSIAEMPLPDSGAPAPLPLACTPWRFVLLVLCVVGVAGVSKVLAPMGENGLPLVVSGGLLLAILLIAHRRYWVYWLAAGLCADVLTCWWVFGDSVWIAIIEAGYHVLGALSAAWLIRRVCGSPFRLSAPREAVVLNVFSVIPGALISAGLEYVVLSTMGKPVSVAGWLAGWAYYALGGMVVAPIVLSAADGARWWRTLAPMRWLEAGVLLLSIVLVSCLVTSTPAPLAFLLLPLVVWSALRFDTFGVMLGVLVAAAAIMINTAGGAGAYVLANETLSRLLVHSLIGVLAFGSLVLSTVISQRRLALHELKAAHDTLEARVLARTSELAHSEARLRENEQRFRLARGAARIIIVDWEIEPDILTFSDSPEWLRGPLPAGGKYPLFKEQIHPEDRARFLEVRARSIATLLGQTLQYRFIRTDGVELHIQSHQTMVAGPDGKAVRLLAIHQDITERRKAERALLESEARLRTVLDAIPDEVRLKDLDGRYIMVNRAAAEFLGRPEAEIVGRTIFELRPREVAEKIAGEDTHMLETGKTTRIERLSYIRPDLWREEITAPIRDGSGDIGGIVSISRDITERKKAEAETLRERDEHYRNLVEQASDAIYLMNAHGHFAYCNASAARILGCDRDELIGRHYLEFVRPDFKEQALGFYMRQFRERIPATYFEMPVLAKDGRTVWVGQHVQQIVENNWVLSHQGVCRDITERVVAQEALRDSNDQLRRLSVRQEELLEAERVRFAHDLHDSIGQSVNLARIKLADLANRNSLAALSNEFREVMQVIDEANLLIRTLEFDLSPPVLRELGLEPALEWLTEEMLRVYGLHVSVSRDDADKPLNQVCRAVVFRSVRELLINVARHAGTQDVHLDTQRLGDTLIIIVSDEGNGFDVARTNKGLGLTGVQERFTQLGGRVTITSEPGEGAVVKLELPLTLEENCNEFTRGVGR